MPGTLYSDHGSGTGLRRLATQHVHPTLPLRPGRDRTVFRSVNKLFRPGLPALPAELHAFIVDYYNQHRHNETRQAPHQRWDADRFLPHTLLSRKGKQHGP
jgi:hypothetical protein